MVEKYYKYDVFYVKSCIMCVGSCLALHSARWKLPDTV